MPIDQQQWQQLLQGMVAAQQPSSSPYAAAVQQALQQYPFLRRLGAPLSLTTGSGPGESESYMPHMDDNPTPDDYTVQLRSAQAKANQAAWPAILGSEGLDWEARKDPVYQSFAEQFRDMMTSDQLRQSRKAYQRDIKDFGSEGVPPNFEDWLKNVQIQEYFRGFLFPQAAPGWKGPNGEGGYTPSQEKLLTQLWSHLSK